MKTEKDMKSNGGVNGQFQDDVKAKHELARSMAIGRENEVDHEKNGVSSTTALYPGDRKKNNEGATEGGDEQQDQSNVPSVQMADQRRYLYTVWGEWSACTRTCGKRAYAFRKRYCIDTVNGEIKRRCQRPTILAKKCALTPCPGEWFENLV